MNYERACAKKVAKSRYLKISPTTMGGIVPNVNQDIETKFRVAMHEVEMDGYTAPSDTRPWHRFLSAMIHIRLATPQDLDKLACIERSAASVFRDAGLAWVADSGTMDREALAAMCAGNTLWVAAVQGNIPATNGDEPVGFLGAHPLDGQFYIAEVSVARAHQRKGIGARLIKAAIDHAARAGFPAATLTTYRDLPWNGPYYARMGFAEVPPLAVGPDHRHKLHAEAEAGHDLARRCVMTKRLA
ncbi:GNAT family N-acetyltransferase [Bordetella genomosp. 9]|nr:GNAT family N-acetyltransferase [Bordetella genomosp. 9]